MPRQTLTKNSWINPEILDARINRAEVAERSERMATEKSSPWTYISESESEADLQRRIDLATLNDDSSTRQQQVIADYKKNQEVQAREDRARESQLMKDLQALAL